MTEVFNIGDKVQWHSPQGPVQGTIKKKLTASLDIKGHHVAASKDNPEFIVETADGKRAAHKASALKKD